MTEKDHAKDHPGARTSKTRDGETAPPQTARTIVEENRETRGEAPPRAPDAPREG